MSAINVPREQLMDLIEKLGKFSGMPIDIYAVGGTALTLLGLKDSTRDVDLNIGSEKGYEEVKRIFAALNFERISENGWGSDAGFRIDLFKEGYIFSTQLSDDYKKISKEIRNFGKIRLLAISPYDIIITKLARMDGRDSDDIRTIFEKGSIDVIKLAGRFIETMENSLSSEARGNMLLLLKHRLKEWGFGKNEEAIRKVEKWEQKA